MTTAKLRLVSFGSARELTRDLITGDYMEVQANDSLFPPIG